MIPALLTPADMAVPPKTGWIWHPATPTAHCSGNARAETFFGAYVTTELTFRKAVDA
jgi:hypothetical protein